MKIAQTLLTVAALLTAIGTAQAAMVPTLGNQLVNDSDLNITWLANANLAATNTFGLARDMDLGTTPGVTTVGGSYIYNDGSMTWGGALKWIAAMNAANYLGFNDWRLPITLQPDASCGNQISGVSFGYNCTGSEMGHLFYNELGGVAGQSITATHNTNYDFFQNVQSHVFWSSTECAPGSNCAWYFRFSNGNQSAGDKSGNLFAMAVRTGQVASVPVPGALSLLGSGLLGLIGIARTKQLNRLFC